MTRLSTFSNYLEAYLKIHGDKEVLSVATRHGDKNCDFIVHMADIHDGPIGTNPYTGRDELPIPAGVVDDTIIFVEEEKTAYEDGVDEGFDQGYKKGYESALKEAEERSSRAVRIMKILWAVEAVFSVLNLIQRLKKKK